MLVTAAGEFTIRSLGERIPGSAQTEPGAVCALLGAGCQIDPLGDYQSGDGVRYRELYHRTPPVRRMPDVIIGMENAINLTLRNFKAALPLQRSGGV